MSVLKLPAKPDQFPVTWVDDAKLELGARPILKGLIEPGAFVVIYGPPGSGKSFFTADMAQHIAIGAAWRGKRVAQSLVVYVAAEAGRSILKRFVAWRDNRLSELSRVPLAILTRGPNLLNLVDVEKLAEQLRVLRDAANLPLGLVVFDTLSRSIHGGDENKAEDMTMVVAAADRLRDEFSTATAYVHHSGKDVTKGARGHSALHAAADLVMVIDNHVATVEKVRDGVAGERFPFSLQTIEIGTDADGDPVTTCLLDHTNTAPAASNKDRLPSGRNQRIVLPALRAIAEETNNRSPGTSAIPRGVLMVSIQQVVERIAPKFGGDDPAYRVREKIKDALMGLQAAGFIGVHGDSVWLL